MKELFKKLIDVATAGVEIAADAGPHFPSRRGNVHITAGAVAQAIGVLDNPAAKDRLENLARHVLAELAEMGSEFAHAELKKAEEKLLAELRGTWQPVTPTIN